QTNADARHVRHLRGGDGQLVGKTSDLVHADGKSGKRFRMRLRRADAALVIDKQIDRFLHVVSDGGQVEIARTDKLVFLQRGLQPLQQSLPIIAAEKNQRITW